MVASGHKPALSLLNALTNKNPKKRGRCPLHSNPSHPFLSLYTLSLPNFASFFTLPKIFVLADLKVEEAMSLMLYS